MKIFNLKIQLSLNKLFCFITILFNTITGCHQAPLILDHTGRLKTPDHYIAYTDCKPHDENCNMCAVDVESQFKKAFIKHGGYKSQIHNWSFDWNKTVPPSSQPVTYFFDAPIKPGNKKPDAFAYHIQGFVRTNDSKIKYAGSHSNAPHTFGSLFFISQTDGKNSLESIHKTGNRHPGGLAVLGQYIFAGEGKNIRAYNIKQYDQSADKLYKLPKNKKNPYKHNTTGGGIGTVKLDNGKILLVVSTPGGTKPNIRRNKFFLLQGTPLKNLKAKFINEQEYSGPDKYMYSENLTLIPECHTGRIYAIHSGSNHALGKKAYWRLSVLTEKNKNPVLITIAVQEVFQNLNNCHLRSAGTVYVNKKSQLEFYCHEYINNKDFGDIDTWNFKRIYY